MYRIQKIGFLVKKKYLIVHENCKTARFLSNNFN